MRAASFDGPSSPPAALPAPTTDVRHDGVASAAVLGQLPRPDLLQLVVRHPLLMHHHRLIAVVVAANLAVLGFGLSGGRWWSGHGIALTALATVAQAKRRGLSPWLLSHSTGQGFSSPSPNLAAVSGGLASCTAVMSADRIDSTTRIAVANLNAAWYEYRSVSQQFPST